MNNLTLDLRNIRRYLDFPLKISTIGFRPKNDKIHQHHLITKYFLCFVLNEEKAAGISSTEDRKIRLTDPLPHMALVPPGTILNQVVSNCKYEVFFTYPAEAKEQLEMFHLRRCRFELTPAFRETLSKIQNSLTELQRPGVADRLDCLAIELAQEAMIASLENSSRKNILIDERIFLISQYFQLYCDKHLNLNSMLRKYGMSRRTFYREWGKYYSVSPAQYLIDLRLKCACEMLNQPGKKIYEIASESGFCDTQYFQRCFSRRYGMSPGHYRKQVLKI